MNVSEKETLLHESSMKKVTDHFDTENVGRFFLRNLVSTTKASCYNNAENYSFKLCCVKI